MLDGVRIDVAWVRSVSFYGCDEGSLGRVEDEVGDGVWWADGWGCLAE